MSVAHTHVHMGHTHMYIGHTHVYIGHTNVFVAIPNCLWAIPMCVWAIPMCLICLRHCVHACIICHTCRLLCSAFTTVYTHAGLYISTRTVQPVVKAVYNPHRAILHVGYSCVLLWLTMAGGCNMGQWT